MNDNIYIFRQGDYKKTGELLFSKDSMACEDCLLGMYVWKDRYGLRLYRAADSSFVYSGAFGTFLTPVPYMTEDALELMKEIKERPVITRVTDKDKLYMEEHFPGMFTFEEDDGSFDYIYDIEALASLKGKKLAKKRNHVNGFLSEYPDWHTEEISFDNLLKCRDFLKKWYAEKIAKEDDYGIDSLMAEKNSLFNVLENYEGVMADGIILFAGKETAALTIGQRISSHTYDVVFEKADESVKGAYNMINREFAGYISRKYPGIQYMNRENDLGIEGLRRSKNSYRPLMLLKKYTARYVGC